MFINLNGEIVKQEDAKISPFDHGYLYGVGLFETFRVYDGHPFLLDDHLFRLQQGLNDLQIDTDLDRTEITSMISSLLKVNKLTNAYLRFNISAGIGDIGLQVSDYLKPTVILFAKPIVTFSNEKKAVILSIPRNTPEGYNRLKSHHFLNNLFAKREIGPDPEVEGIFLTKDGYLAEGITSNLFWIKDRIIYTPTLETGILNGVTRDFIMKVCNHLGLRVEEGLYTLSDLESCQEAFITNSIQEIVPLTKLHSIVLPGKDGTITKVLQNIYAHYKGKLFSRYEIDGVTRT